MVNETDMNKLARIITLFSIAAMQSLGTQAQTNSTSDDVNYASFGEKISPDDAQSITHVNRSLMKQDSVAVKVNGTVNEVCQVKGCWMTISEKDVEVEPLFVKFKDYGFFVPKDISGQEVIMEGMAYREITSVEELRHYAEDAGKTKEEIEAINEPKEELRFLASGVLVKN